MNTVLSNFGVGLLWFAAWAMVSFVLTATGVLARHALAFRLRGYAQRTSELCIYIGLYGLIWDSLPSTLPTWVRLVAALLATWAILWESKK